jgi:hypothetical protein
VDAGVALACDPRSAESVGAALRWAATHRDALAEMGERGRQRALHEWNYDVTFARVRDEIAGASRVSAERVADARHQVFAGGGT